MILTHDSTEWNGQGDCSDDRCTTFWHGDPRSGTTGGGAPPAAGPAEPASATTHGPALSFEHHQHLADELGEAGADLAQAMGARSVSEPEAVALGFRLRAKDGRWQSSSGILLPFAGEFAQLRCDDPPLNAKGDPCKYLNRSRVKQTLATFGDGPPTIATEGWKDAIRLHIETGQSACAVPGVSCWKQLPDSVRLLIYDADATTNPHVWGQLAAAGIARPELRLAFFSRAVAGDKGGACEFFNNGGEPQEIGSGFTARKLLLHLATLWSHDLRADYHAPALRGLARRGLEVGLDHDAVSQLVVGAAKRLRFPVARARALIPPPPPRTIQTQNGEVAACPTEPTKQQLQAFIATALSVRWNDLSRIVELNGKQMEQSDLADQFLAHNYGVEVHRTTARDAFRYVALAFRFNPVAEYLQGLKQRTGLKLLPLAEIAAAFGIAPDDELSAELLARHLVGGYRRGLTPGYKHDQIVILHGKQGYLKGSALEALAPPNCFSSATRVPRILEDREFLSRLNSAWIFEFDEVEKTLLGRDAAELKGFLSRRDDAYVEKYETQTTRHPRRPLMFGTSNASEILNDHTGSRRIWIVPCGVCNPRWIEENRDSIWATVATWAEWGLENWIPEGHATTGAAADRAEAVRIAEPWEGAITAYLERPGSEHGVALDSMIRAVLELPTIERITRDVQMRFTRCITASTFRTHDGTRRWIQQKRRYDGGAPRAGYMPVAVKPAQPVPTAQPVPVSNGENWNGQKPWERTDLEVVFQLFQPLRETPIGEITREGPRDRGEADPYMSSPNKSGGQNERNGWNSPQTDCAAVDLPAPTGSDRSDTSSGTPPPPTAAAPAGPRPTTNGGWITAALAALNLAPDPEAASPVWSWITAAGGGVSHTAISSGLARLREQDNPLLAGPPQPPATATPSPQPPYWGATLQQLATANPDATAAGLAELLWSGFGVRTTPAEVMHWLAAWPPA